MSAAHILVVDDEADIRGLLKEILSEEGYDVDVAAHKYLAALEDGDVPLLLLFSGQVFTGTAGAITVQPVPWHKETAVLLPVAVWREAPMFSTQERAALGWAEALTLLPQGGVSDEVYEDARAVFSEQELLDLSVTVASINAWNRFGVGFRFSPLLQQAQAKKTG